MTNKYDIFISYRRDNGEDKARILNQFLNAAGYKVFFDHESGMTGEFETEILAAVEIAPVFLMLLTPHCLDRCIKEDDWVRREVERAYKFNKEIIPIRPNYDSSMFDGLPKETPEYITRLSKLEFAEIDFHKNFKATANTMVEEQIKKIIQPSITIASTGDKGAIIHFFSDISCRVLHYGTPIAITDAADTTIGAVARLLKGNHKLEYISIEHESDAYSQDYNIPDNEYETFVNIELQPIKDKRKEKEEEQKIELEQKAAEEKARRERNNLTRHDNRHKYDVFFTYSRKDAHIVRKVYHFLQQSGLRCWIDMDGVASGDMFAEKIAETINQSKCLLFFSSEYSNQSNWAKREVEYANKMNIKILTIAIDETPLNYELLFELGLRDTFNLNLNDNNNMEKLIKAINYLLD